MTSVLNSHFVIDGERRENTLSELLSTVCVQKTPADKLAGEDIVDESLDSSPVSIRTDNSEIPAYSRLVKIVRMDLPLAYSASYTVFNIATAIADSLFRQGNVSLDEIQLTAKWRWNDKSCGNMAALYNSVETAVQYLDDLGVSLHRYAVEEGEDPELSVATQFTGAARIVPDTIVPDPASWIIFVPFDSAEFRLGGSALAEALSCGGVQPKLGDADYFMDCFELVREFAMDNVLLSARTVQRGGLRKALDAYAGEGAALELSGVLQAYPDCNAVDILFSEVPGVLIQIRNEDYDYLDAEFLLQDVAWYPLGHPSGNRLTIDCSAKSKINTILESLLQKAEGED